MQNMTHGQNLVIDNPRIKIGVACELSQGDSKAVDVSAFLLSENNKTRTDDDFIFYNQPTSQDQSVSLTITAPNRQSFAIDLTEIADDIHKIAFVITTPTAFKLASSLTVEVEGIAKFEPNITQMNETSLILAEIYRHKGQWKFKAIGQGYAGGLAPIAIGYGVDIDDEPSPPATTVVKATPTIAKSAAVSIKKVDLSKAGEEATISLAKGKKLTAKLKWDTAADLDLYCFYVDKNDAEDKVYYRRLGDLSSPPFIKLLGDSQIAGEEVLEISQPEQVKYALICAYSAVSNGVGSFHSYKARVLVTDNNQQSVTSHLNHDDPNSYWVAFALIDFQEAGKVTIKNVETYSNPKTFAAQLHEKGVDTPTGLFKKLKPAINGVTKYDPERSPSLYKDGSFMMSVGAREFK
jgi:stress response protein SCP2